MSRRNQPSPGQRVVAGLLILTQFFWLPPQVRGATLYWNTDASAGENNVDGTGLGGSGTWDTTLTNWWDQSALVAWPNTNIDHAIFSAPAVPPNLSTVTLSSGITANKLSFFRSGYTLTGGDLTLAGAAPTLHANLGEHAIIDSQIMGSDGLTKTGGGAVRLGNSGNTYTGATTINNGTLILNHPGALGLDNSAVVINGSATRGFGGGGLLLEGNYAGGMNFTRSISLQGLGPIGGNSVSLVSVGSNTISGAVTNGSAAVNTGLTSVGGDLTLSDVTVGGTAGTTFMTFGTGGGAGAGSYAINGVLSGSGSIQKTGGGTLILNPSSAAGFSGTLRVTAGSIRVTSGASLGTNAGTGTSSMLDLNGDNVFFEIRSDTPTIGKNVYQRGVSPAMFADHAIGSSMINGTATFGTLLFEDNETFTFNSRNGFGMTYSSATVNGGDNASNLTNNLGGLLTITGNFWNNSDTGAARTLTVAGGGNTLVSGNLLASGGASFDHNLTKTGAGLLTITSTGATIDGAINIQGGAIAITDFRSITNNASTINLANATTTAGALIIGTGTAATGAGLTTSKVINLFGTTGGGTIYANQAGANPVILNGAITATGTGAKTLTLGGTSTVNNIVNSAIPDSAGATVTSLAKNGPGTWVLAGASTFTGGVTITDGTLKLQDTFSGGSRNVIASTAAITFTSQATTQEAGATLEYVGAAGNASAESLGALTPTAGANTVKVTPGSGGTAALTFTSLGTNNANASVNFISSGANTIAATGAAGYISNSRYYFNGGDFAFFGASGVVRAPVYGTDAGFSAANTFTANNHALITANSSTAAIAQRSVKLSGNVTLTISGNLTLNNNATNTAGNILATGGSSEITGAGGITGPGTNILGIRVNNSTDTLTISSNIIGGTGGLNKNGDGKLILTGLGNTITGETRINEGEIELGAGSRLGGNGTNTFTALTIRGKGTLDIGGNSIGVAALNGSGTIINDGAAATLTVGNADGTGTWAGVMKNGTGVLSIAKVGIGNQTWSGLNSYTGPTTIGSTGLVTVNTLGNVGTASGIGAGDAASDATNAASLVFNGSTGGLVYAGSLLNGTLTLGAASTSTNRLFTLAGTGATLSSTAINNNAIVWSNTGAIAHGIVGPQTLTLTGTSTGDNWFFPQLTDSGTDANITSLTKTGTGLWVLGNSNNTYTGTTTVANGTLRLGSAGSLPTNSPLMLGSTTTSGVLETSGEFTRGIASSATAGSNTVFWGGTTGGGGFAASTDKLIVAIGGTATPTALQWGSGGFVGTGGAQTLFFGSATALDEVEFRNAIDLNGAIRTISITDNTTTFTDVATITGVISNSAGGNTGGISKAGTGTLQLFGANTYDGTTAVTAGTLTVNSLGLSTATAGGTSVGTNVGANTQAQAITLGNAGTTAGILQYVGPGETSDRMIRINTTTGSTQLHADGSGPLILTNVLNDMAVGNKTLFLRGSNTQGNTITSALADNLAGTNTLGITVDGGATWILSGSNTYTGITDITAGALGAGSNDAFGTGIMRPRNGSLFAYGGDRTLANPITINTTTTAGTSTFIGDHSLTLTGNWTYTNTSGGHTFTNSIATGKTLTVGGTMAFDAITAARTLTINGPGDTILNGDITTTTAFGVNVAYAGTGSLTLGAASPTWGTGSLTVSSGTLRLGNDDVIPHGTGRGNVTINPAVGITARLDLNGRTETINGLTGTSAGTMIIDNSAATLATFIVGGNDQAASFNGSLTRSGGGGLTLGKIGTGTATFAGPVNVTAIDVQAGGLKLTGGITAPNAITSISVAGGGLLQMFDGVGTPLTGLTLLSLGAGTGTATLELEAGDLSSDSLSTSNAATIANNILLNVRDGGISPGGTYTLLTAPSGLMGGSYTLGPIGGYTGSFLTVTDTSVQLTVGSAVLGNMYWTGAGLPGPTGTTQWNTVDGSGNGSNFSSDKAGTVLSTTVPGAGTTVVFQANSAAGGALSTTLEQSFRINNLIVETSTNPLTSLVIAPGASAANRLTIQPTLATDGIELKAGAPLGVAITSQLSAGSNQTWKVADFSTVPLTGGVTTTGSPTVTVASTAGLVAGMQIAGPGIPTGAFILQVVNGTSFTMSANATGQNAALQTYSATSALSLSGGLFGSGNITKADPGRVVLGGAGNTYTGTAVNITGGILEINNVTGLGGIAATPGSGATVTVGSGGQFRINSATAGTVANPLVLNGGMLSSGGFTSNATTLALTIVNHTYSAPVNVSADSSVHLAELASHATLSHTITLSGVLSGTGKVAVDSVGTLTGGNPLSGSLTLSNANSGWSGGLDMKRGTVTATNVAALGTGNITASGGRITFNTAGGTTFNLPQNITIDAAGGLLELNADASGTPVSDMTVNLSGVITLGSTSNANNALRVSQNGTDNLSIINISNSIVLGNNASISYQGSATRPLHISAIISETGGSRNLAINDELGGWGVTSQTIRLSGANTFSGNLSLTEGTLEFETVSNVGGPASNLGQGSGITLGAATLKFIGSTSQTTDRPITNTAVPILNASGTGGATITFNGPTISLGASAITLDGTGEGILSSAFTTTSDLNKNGTGIWNVNATNTIGDDILHNAGTLNLNMTQAVTDDVVVTGLTSVLNLNAANTHQGDDLFIRAGATVNLGINGALSTTAGMDDLLIGDTASADAAKLDLKGFTSTVDAATIGLDASAAGQIIDTVGGGVFTAAVYTVRHGEASANLAGGTMAKNGVGTFTLKGANTFTGATTVTEGHLILDYTTNNSSKIATAAGLTIGGVGSDATARLTFNGSATTATTQAFTTLTVNGGANKITVTSNGGQAANVNFTTITRTAVGGTVDFTLPAVGNVTTTAPVTNGTIGGYATVNGSTAFASKDASNNIIPLVPTAKNDVTTWLATDNVIDDAGGFSGTTLESTPVNTVTFSQPNSSLNVGGTIGINTGGILIASAGTGGEVLGGRITTASADLVIHQHAAGDFRLSSSMRGSTGITKVGNGSLLLSGISTATGTVSINEGLVKVSGGQAIGDAAQINFKDVAGSGLVLVSSETVGNISGGGLVGGSIALGNNTLTTNVSANVTYNGLITGSGSIVKQGTANLNLDSASSTGFIGSVVVNQGLFQLSGNGIVNLPSVSSITTNSGGALLVDFNSGTTGSSRINDSAAINLNSSGNGAFFGVHVRSNQDVSHSETVGALTLTGGASVIAVSQTSNTTTARTLTLTAASLGRLNNATAFINGRNLAITAGDNNRGRVIFTSAPATVGGAGAPGTSATNVPIVRYLTTLQNPNAVAIADIPNTFANYNATTGITPLNIATEYRLDSAGYAASATATDNLRFTGAASALNTKEFNAVVFDSSAASMTVSGAGGGANVLTVGSGAMLFTSTVLANTTTVDTFDSLTPGANSSNEWIITVANTTATINSVLGQGASPTVLTKSGTGTLVLGADNLYTGGTIINQGVVQADTLARFGPSGDLRFQGGTLRFGGVFDPSARVNLFSAGGATFDTNTNDISLANPIGGGGPGSFTKIGAGILTLNAAASFSGLTTVTDGTLQYGVATALPAANSVTLNAAAATLDLMAHSVNLGTVTLTDGTITGTGSLSASSLLVQGGNIASTLVVAGSGTLTKSGAGTFTLAGTNIYSGMTWVQDGILSFNSIADANGTASALGAPTTAASGTIRVGNITTTGNLNYTGSGHSSNRDIDLTGSTGGAVIDADGTGALVLSGAVTSEEYGTKALTLGGSSAPEVVNAINGPITEGFGVVNLLKTDTNTWQLGGANTYTGSTSVNNGILRFGANQTMSGALNFGSAGSITTAGTLDLSNASATFGSLVAQTNSPTNTSHILIGNGQSLNINGAFTLGSGTATSTTLINASGAGALHVTNTAAAATFGVGGTSSGSTTADFSGLATMNVSLNTTDGLFRVSSTTGTQVSNVFSVMALAANTTITAKTLTVGGGGAFNASAGQVNALKLGSAANILRVDTINIGTGARDLGAIFFNSGTGTLNVRDVAGTGGVAFNMGTGTSTTGIGAAGIANTFDVAGHTADLLFTTVTIGTQNRNSDLTNVFSFNQGTLTMNSLTMSTKGTNGSTTTSTMNLGGGTVAIGTVGGTAVTLATNTGPGSAVATINITGGSVTVTGNVVRGNNTGAGTATGTINLNGGSLNMSGNTVGSATNLITLDAQAGTLTGLGQLNGGGLLTKSTTGLLAMGNGNAYSGGTLISGGTLVAANTTGSATGSGLVTVGASGTLAGGGVISGNVSLAGILAPGGIDPGSGESEAGDSLIGQLTVGGLTASVGGTLQIQLGGATLLDPENVQLFQNDPGSFVVPASWTNYQLGTTAHDQLYISGAGGPNLQDLTIQFMPDYLNGFTPVYGHIFQVIDWASLGANDITGSLSYNLPALDPAYGWDTSFLKTHGVIAVIPEPSRMLLVFVGLLGLAFRRRRTA